jgi:hypothetical protein
MVAYGGLGRRPGLGNVVAMTIGMAALLVILLPIVWLPPAAAITSSGCGESPCSMLKTLMSPAKSSAECGEGGGRDGGGGQWLACVRDHRGSSFARGSARR